MEAKKDMEIDGCTFKPELMTHHKEGKRNKDQFIEDQMKFYDKKNQKIEE